MLPKPSLQWEWEAGYSHLADFMAGLRCQSQSARAKNLKTGKTHPKGLCTAPLWVTAAKAQPGPEVQVGAMLVQGSALDRDEGALGQHIPQPSLTPRA